MIGSSRSGLLCELCGTVRSGSEENHLGISQLLGRQVIDQCCGGVFDALYAELGYAFFERFLEEFLADPMNERFALIRERLAEGLREATRRTEALAVELGTDAQHAGVLQGHKERGSP